MYKCDHWAPCHCIKISCIGRSDVSVRSVCACVLVVGAVLREEVEVFTEGAGEL